AVLVVFCFFFFFQAEDGIRGLIVTGVQTCALPISTADWLRVDPERLILVGHSFGGFAALYTAATTEKVAAVAALAPVDLGSRGEIGRASCRERVESSVVAGAAEEKE